MYCFITADELYSLNNGSAEQTLNHRRHHHLWDVKNSKTKHQKVVSV